MLPVAQRRLQGILLALKKRDDTYGYDHMTQRIKIEQADGLRNSQDGAMGAVWW